MRFRQQQQQARAATRTLVLLFALTVLFTVLAVNGALALAWALQFGGLAAHPAWFYETNTAVTLGFILGGAWLESIQLRDGGAHVARMIGGREIASPQTPAERRLRNVVDEMAIATGLKSPRLFVLDREDAINALAAGWEQQDSVIAVSRGALERLARDELQGVIAHEFAHILNGDTRLNMRLIGMVFGLQMIFNFGRGLMSAMDERGRRGPAVLIGLALVVVGAIGWLAGRLLKAGVSRQREHLADAYAVQFTRQPSGLGNALRKVAAQLGRGQRLVHANAEVVSHLLLSSDTLVRGGWLATHPPIEERLRRIFGRDMGPLADDPIPLADPPRPDLPALNFVEMSAGAAQQETVAAGTAPALTLSAPSALLECLATGLPEQVRAAALACLLPARDGATAELGFWRQAAGSFAWSPRLLQAAQALPQRLRLPCFERLLGAAAALPPGQRRILLRDAIALVQVAGRLSLHEYLLARVLKRQLAMRTARPVLESKSLRVRDLAEPVATVTRALAALLPPAAALAWPGTVLTGLGLAPAPRLEAPALRELDRAIERLAMLGRTERPLLVKQWLAALATAEVPPALAGALRCLCLLIDTPVPPQLARHFDALPPLPEVPEPVFAAMPMEPVS